MKLNLQKKNSFWSLYKNWIIGVLTTIGIFGTVGGCIYIITSRWEGIVEWFTNLGWISITMIIQGTSGTIFIFLILSLIYRYGKFLIRQQFIPLSQSELTDNGIENVEDYSKFLKKYLMGFKPLRKIHKLCFISSFYYLMNEEERKSLFNEYFFSEKFKSKKQRDNAIANILAIPINNNINSKNTTILEDYFEKMMNEACDFYYKERKELNPFSYIWNMSFFTRHEYAKFIIPILLISGLFLCSSSIILILGIEVLVRVILCLLIIAFFCPFFIMLFPY